MVFKPASPSFILYAISTGFFVLSKKSKLDIAQYNAARSPLPLMDMEYYLQGKRVHTDGLGHQVLGHLGQVHTLCFMGLPLLGYISIEYLALNSIEKHHVLHVPGTILLLLMCV